MNGLRRHREDGGDGIQGEDQVGRLDHHQHQGQRGERFASLPGGHELLPIQMGRDRVKLSHPLDDAVLLRVNLGLDEEHLDAGEQDERTEHVEDPLQPGDERRTHADHHAAHDERAEDAPEQARDAGMRPGIWK